MQTPAHGYFAFMMRHTEVTSLISGCISVAQHPPFLAHIYKELSMNYVFQPPPINALPVAGSDCFFPVRRVLSLIHI